ncbi:MAG: hypothetical protein LBJ67_19050 [Planctomycetaceae bacterium]|jgi:hypothetical protein|nr:hypothetical protein [Planctomycetaceae bacterium]
MKKYLILYLLILVLLFSKMFLYQTLCLAITSEEFNVLSGQEKKTLLKDALQSSLSQMQNFSAKYTNQRFLCEFHDKKIISKTFPVTQDQYEYRRIGKSFWFHHWWTVSQNNKFNEVANTEAFESFDVTKGELRTLSTANHYKNKEWYAYIMNELAPACRDSLLPDLFDASCICDSYNVLGHIIQQVDNWNFLESEQNHLILLEMRDYSCEVPEQSSGTRKVWIDPEKNFSVVRELRNLLIANTVVWQVKECDDFQYLEGIWVPQKISVYGCFPGMPEKGSGSLLSVEDMKIGKLKRADLVVDFPKGTKVFDKIKGIEYFEGDPIPGTPSPQFTYVRYSLIILGVIFILLGIWKKIYEIKQGSKG